ncbi:Zinc finger, CCHC-type [Senna tora]|uniref:Zinc finger, CCHC-type n=1 Tax=Senna tora TaxID=362788 RepID=A0A834TP66_9FABA|nr:Zinc finger, CCHC-type [Senna tora]
MTAFLHERNKRGNITRNRQNRNCPNLQVLKEEEKRREEYQNLQTAEQRTRSNMPRRCTSDIVMEGQDENARSHEPHHSVVPTTVTNPNPGWPPGAPLDKGGTEGISFRDKLMGQKRRVAKVPTNLIERELIKIDYHQGNPALPNVIIDDSILKELSKVWENTIIIKVLGRDVGYKYLLNRVKTLWKLKDSFEMIDVGRGYYHISFNLEEDMCLVMEGGPWVILDHYLILRKWAPDFHPETNEIEKTLVWARFPELNMVYYEENVLLAIASAIGSPVKVDSNTIQAIRGRFARVFVEVDLKKPLIGKIWVGGHWIKVEYESLHLLCTCCGTYGHPPKDCPTKRFLVDIDPIEKDVVGSAPGKDGDKAQDKDGQGEGTHGGWMVVTKKKLNRRGLNLGKSGMNNRNFNPFQALGSEEDRAPSKVTDAQQNNLNTTSQNRAGTPTTSKNKRLRIEKDEREQEEPAPTSNNSEQTSNLVKLLKNAFKSGSTRKIQGSQEHGSTRDYGQSQDTCVPSTFPFKPGVSGTLIFQSSRPPDLVPTAPRDSTSNPVKVASQSKDGRKENEPFDICGNDPEEMDSDLRTDHARS